MEARVRLCATPRLLRSLAVGRLFYLAMVLLSTVNSKGVSAAELKAQLDAIPGLPANVATQIVQLRPFTSKKDLRARVVGLGPKLLSHFEGSAASKRTNESRVPHDPPSKRAARAGALAHQHMHSGLLARASLCSS